MTTATATVLTAREWAVEIDTTLAAFWDAESELATPLKRAVDAVYRAAGMDPVGTTYSRWQTPKPQGTFTQALQVLESVAALPLKPWHAMDAAKAVGDYVVAKRAMDEVKAAQEPFNEEYRLGRWTRAFLVLNTGGHVHRDRNCSTCYPTTRYGWLPQLSGADEAYIVEQSGSDACTVCFPTAPVASLSQPRRALHPTEVEAQQAREAKAAAKVEREAKKAAKAIANPDGTPLEVFDYRSPERQVRDRYGSITTIPARDRFETIETAAMAKSWLTDSQESWSRGKRPEDIQRVAEALAHKNGTTPEAEITAAVQRAAKRK